MPTCLLAIVLAPSCSTELRIGSDPDQALHCFSLCGSQSSDMSRTRSGIATGFSHCLSMLSSSNVSYPVASWTELKFLGRLGVAPWPFNMLMVFHWSSILPAYHLALLPTPMTPSFQFPVAVYWLHSNRHEWQHFSTGPAVSSTAEE